MKFTRSFILQAYDDSSIDKEKEEYENLLNISINNPQQNNLSPEQIKKKYFLFFKMFILSNNIIDKYICITFSIFAMLTTLFIIYTNDTSFCYEQINKKNVLTVELCNKKYEYMNSHLFMIKYLILSNIALNSVNVLFFNINKNSQKDLSLSTRINIFTLNNHWHLIKSAIIFIIKSTFVFSILLNFCFIFVYGKFKESLENTNYYGSILVFEVYSFFSIVRVFYFAFNIISTILIFPIFISAFFISIYEDSFNKRLNKIIKTEIKSTTKYNKKNISPFDTYKLEDDKKDVCNENVRFIL